MSRSFSTARRVTLSLKANRRRVCAHHGTDLCGPVRTRGSRRALGFLSPSSLKPAGPNATILQTSLPAHVDLRGLVGALRGTWIGPLRWYGFSESDEGLRLGWALEDDTIGIEILVRPGQLTMTAKVDSPSRFDEATRLGYELFHHVSREISSKTDRGISA